MSLGFIVTFYSYKGGTGRSMSLANVACLLAKTYRVLMIDWDLEAPGLHRYFKEKENLDDPELEESNGLIDMFWDYSNQVLTPDAGQKKVGGTWDPMKLTNPNYYIMKVKLPEDKFPRRGDYLHFIGSGRQGSEYADRARGFDWQNFYNRLGGREFLDGFRGWLKTQYDFVLIDSRTGLNDTAGICTLQMPDLVVLCFTLNRQSILGVEAVAQSIQYENQKRGIGEKIRLLPTPMRVPVETTGLDEAHDYAWSRLNPFFSVGAERTRTSEDRRNYLKSIHISERPQYSLIEKLALFHEDGKTKNSMYSEISSLSEKIIGRGEKVTVFIHPSGSSVEGGVNATLESRLHSIIDSCSNEIQFQPSETILPVKSTNDVFFMIFSNFQAGAIINFATAIKQRVRQDNAEHPSVPLQLLVFATLGEIIPIHDRWSGIPLMEAEYVFKDSNISLLLKSENPVTILISDSFMTQYSNHMKNGDRERAHPGSTDWIRYEIPGMLGNKVVTYINESSENVERINKVLTPWLTESLSRTQFIHISIGSSLVGGCGPGLCPIERLYIGIRGIENGNDDAPEKKHETDLRSFLFSPLREPLLIEGSPGSGKTTFLKYVSTILTRDLLGVKPSENGSWREKYLKIGVQPDPPVPLLLLLSELSWLLAKDAMPNIPDDRFRILDLLQTTPEADARPAWREYWENLFKEGRVVLLLDGFDEVAVPGLQRRVYKILQDVIKCWGNNFIVLSSRPFAARNLVELGIRRIAIQPFNKKEINEFIALWNNIQFSYASENNPIAMADQIARTLMTAVWSNPAISRLASSPLILASLCVLHWDHGQLPESRVRFYNDVLIQLLERREVTRKSQGYDMNLAMEAFAKIAMTMMGSHGQEKRINWDLEEAAELVLPLLISAQGIVDKDIAAARKWIRFECLYSGILNEIQDNRLQFLHLTFQEYLAAWEIAQRQDDGESGWWPVIGDNLEDGQWHETMNFLPGLLFGEGGGSRVDKLLFRVLMKYKGENLENKVQSVIILGDILEAMKGYSYQPQEEILEQYRQILNQFTVVFTPSGAAEVPVAKRYSAADILGREGDPRLVEAQWRENFITVPGTGIALGKYLVTVQEYQCFIENGGYDNQDYWPEDDAWNFCNKLKWKEPEGWLSQLNHPNHPVTGVSRYEAIAYCNWLSSQSNGEHFFLPTEDDWKRAATPTSGEYPWGTQGPNPELANYGGGKDYHTSPVGIYPDGNGPYGHCDLGGNVSEWCDTDDKNGQSFDKERESGESSSITKGGSYLLPESAMKIGSRMKISSSGRMSDLGFRVAVVEAMVDPIKATVG
ncbi:MAG: SUMF1/EgtB/PvdO family nonheme iron enzyme [Nitrospirae bacterium]|nr:SUMF1/EgtB/PvdO family nonheme iron enzyme [Magnetococcales bacterium]HAT50531.1 hypothetical protein [Alphaproteobacteria bacterium]